MARKTKLHIAGFVTGRKWASEHAEPKELDRLADLNSDWQAWDVMFTDYGTSAYDAGQRFVFTIRPEIDKDREAATVFWESIVGNEGLTLTESADWVCGFAEGVLSAADELANKS